jgi:arogenate dehydrogenase (NADP+), plant
MKPEQVSIIGYGRFGQLFASILRYDFDVQVTDSNPEAVEEAKAQGLPFVTESVALAADAVFYCVPISKFEEIFADHVKYIHPRKQAQIFADVLSVKVHPKLVFERLLPAHCQAFLTHPMFGPDSVAVKGLPGQTIVLDQFKLSDENYEFWKDFFANKQLNVIEMFAEEHDKLAAQSQGLTHFVGRVLGEFGFAPTLIDTLGAKMLHNIQDQVCNDTWQLFEDLQTYNPATVEMRVKLADAQSRIFNRLLPNRVDKKTLIVGIQGGRGSFNEEAATYYLSRTPEMPYELRYLHTTENVLRALYEGRIDRGQFAIHNSIGGIVGESVEAMSHYRFHILEEFAIKIAHALMIAPGADFNKVDTIMTHPQVLRQCKKSLEMKYPRLKQTSGDGERVDHAKVAELIACCEIPANVAVMGSKVLAHIYGLHIVEDNLQDLEENFTSFLWVERPS